MALSQEFFSTETTLPKLVEWFNSQPSSARTVTAGELFVIRVKVVQVADGDVQFVVGADPVATDDSRWYMGESVFMWVGPTGTNLTATESSFFEMSRNVPVSLNVIATNAWIGTGSNEAVVRRMAYGMDYNSGADMNAPYANWIVAISQNGRVSIDVQGSYYMNPPNSLDSLPEVLDAATGSGYVAVRTIDNDVYVWGDNNQIHDMIYNGPVKIEYDPQTGSTMKATRIAALSKLLIFVRENGTLGYVGETYGSRLQTDPDSLEQFSDVKDIRGYYWYDPSSPESIGYELLYIIHNDGTLKTWGWKKENGLLDWSELNVPALAIGGAYNPVTDVKDVAFNHDRAIVLHTDGTTTEFGTNGYHLSVLDETVVAVAATITGKLAALTSTGDVHISLDSSGAWTQTWEGCTMLSGGWDYFIAAPGGTSKTYYHDYYSLNAGTFDADPAQIQAGVRMAAFNLADPARASESAFFEVRVAF